MINTEFWINVSMKEARENQIKNIFRGFLRDLLITFWTTVLFHSILDYTVVLS